MWLLYIKQRKCKNGKTEKWQQNSISQLENLELIFFSFFLQIISTIITYVVILLQNA